MSLLFLTPKRHIIFFYPSKYIYKFLLALLIFNCTTSLADTASLNKAQALINSIRQGGYILYLRHAASDRSQTDNNTSNLDDCSQQRNLSTKGRMQAKAIGLAFNKLHIPVGKVTSSPYCRCVDTAQLAFAQKTISYDLRFNISVDEKETLRLAKSLKKMLSTAPSLATNFVIVSHTGNLKEAANVWPKPEGVLHVFKPLGTNGFKHLGKILPDQWALLK